VTLVGVYSLIQWLPSSTYERGGEDGGGAEYQSALGGSVTVYVDSGKGVAGPTLGGAGYSKVRTVQTFVSSNDLHEFTIHCV